MSIGSITSVGKQNATSSGELKYKKIQKGEASFCFLGDDTVVDFASLVNFILTYGGSSITTQDTIDYKRTAIPAARGYLGGSYVTSYTSFTVSQTKSPSNPEWTTPSTIAASGYHSTSGNPFDHLTIDNTWTVV